MTAAAALAATVRDTLSWIHTHPKLSIEFQRDAEAALDALLARCEEAERSRDALIASVPAAERAVIAERRAEAAEARVRELEADPDRPTVVYAGDELEASEARVAELEQALREIADGAVALRRNQYGEWDIHWSVQDRARAALAPKADA